jgi:hypothetical protein
MPDNPVTGEPSARATSARLAFFQHVLVMHEPHQDGEYVRDGGCRDCPSGPFGGICKTYRAAWDFLRGEAGID